MSRTLQILLPTLVTASLLTFSPVHAQSKYTIGQHLSAEQSKALGSLKAVEVNGQMYQVLQTGLSATGLPFTMLLDPNGTVGQTYHELQIVDQPTEQVRQKLAVVLSKAQTVKYYDHMQTTLMRFDSLDHAVQALNQALAAMPDAEIGIPITFSRPSLR